MIAPLHSGLAGQQSKILAQRKEKKKNITEFKRKKRQYLRGLKPEAGWQECELGRESRALVPALFLGQDASGCFCL